MSGEQKHNRIIREYFASDEGKSLLQGKIEISDAVKLKSILLQSAELSLLAEKFIDRSSGSKRKDNGMFFTPYPVALSMVQAAFELWQQEHNTLEELQKIRVLDPACGSGEFLLAALEVLLKAGMKMQQNASPDELAASIIKNNLFGIDCDRNVLDILQDRFKTAYGQTICSKHLRCGNSLDRADASTFFAPQKKFDLVIGNPPYVSYGLRNVGKLDAINASVLRSRFSGSAEYKIAVYALFMELALNSTCRGGVHTFIVPDSFLCGQYFGKLRNFMLKNCAFEQIALVSKKIFKAVPGSLVIYSAVKRKPGKDHRLNAVSISNSIDAPDSKQCYSMLQSEFQHNNKQRFRLFFDEQTHKFVRDFEKNSCCLLGDILTLYSGLVAKSGQSSIVADSPQRSGNWQRGITSGSAVTPDGIVKWQGKYIDLDPDKIKSGLSKVDYSAGKIFIRQTGDRIIAGIDRSGLAALNNLHIGTAKNAGLDLEKLVKYLNSNEVLRYYQSITLEKDRPMAQVDLETLRMLPVQNDLFK